MGADSFSFETSALFVVESIPRIPSMMLVVVSTAVVSATGAFVVSGAFVVASFVVASFVVASLVVASVTKLSTGSSFVVVSSAKPITEKVHTVIAAIITARIIENVFFIFCYHPFQ
jgi:hypothetical protein